MEWAGGVLYVNLLILPPPWKLLSSASQIMNFILQILNIFYVFQPKGRSRLACRFLKGVEVHNLDRYLGVLVHTAVCQPLIRLAKELQGVFRVYLPCPLGYYKSFGVSSS